MDRRRFFQMTMGAGAAILASKYLPALPSPAYPLSPPPNRVAVLESFSDLDNAEALSRLNFNAEALSRLIRTVEGRKQLAESLTRAVQSRMHASSFVRQSLKLSEATGREYGLIQQHVTPMIPVCAIKERRFGRIAHSVNLAQAQLVATETGMLFKQIEKATDPTEVVSLGCKGMKEVCSVNGRPAYSIAVNPRDYCLDILREPLLRGMFVRETRERLRDGWFGTYHGERGLTRVFVGRSVPFGRVYSVAHPCSWDVWRKPLSAEMVSTPVTVYSADDVEARQIGFAFMYNFAINVNPEYVKVSHLPGFHTLDRSQFTGHL